MQNSNYRAAISMIHVGPSGGETTIPPEAITSVIIDYNYGKLTFPIIYVSLNLAKGLFNTIMVGSNDGYIAMQIRKYDSNSNNPMMTDRVQDMFIYFLPNDDPTFTKDYTNQDVSNAEKTDYNRVTIGLIKIEFLNNNKRTINGLFKNTNMMSLVHKATSHMNCVIQPFDHNTSIGQILIPPFTSIRKYLEYLNNYAPFYNGGFTYFIDFDRTYILSKAGVYIDPKDGQYTTVAFDVKATEETADSQQYSGMIRNSDQEVYYIFADTTSVSIVPNKATEKTINHIIGVSGTGTVGEGGLKANNSEASSAVQKSKYVRSDGGSEISGYIKEIEQSINGIQITKSDVDSSIITPNKEYIINNYENNTYYNGNYYLDGKKEIFLTDGEEFKMAVSVVIKKI